MKARLSIYLTVAVALIFLAPQMPFSHPHVFVENRMVMILDDQGLAGIRVKWIFDEFFSSMISGDHDRNHNDKLENSEINAIKKEAFDNLADFGYFTSIKIDGKPFKVKYVRNFSADLAQGRLIYEFLIPCHVKGASNFKEITISQYDPSYYTLILFARERPVSIEGGLHFEIHHCIVENLKEAYYFGMIHPIELILKFRLKNE